MTPAEITETRFSKLPRWVPLVVSVFSVLLVVGAITWMFAFLAMTLTEANEPASSAGLETRYETINQEALERIEPRLSPPKRGE